LQTHMSLKTCATHALKEAVAAQIRVVAVA
jgi:hypothetical protein